LPLKPDDLKTLENYKKAIRNDASKIGPQGNTKFWVYKDIELPTASGAKQKLPALISLVDDTAAKAVLKGKLPLCAGTCKLEQGQISFQAAQGTVPYGILTKTVPLLLGKMVNVPAGVKLEPDGPEQKAPPAQAAAPVPGIVKYRRALVEFAQAKTVMQGQITNLRSAILKAAPHEVSVADDLAKQLSRLNSELAAAVDEAIKAAENEASPATDAVKSKIQKYIAQLASNPLVKKADANPLGVPVTIQKTLGEALGRIREAMPA
jgi:hypothetical protein